MKELSPAEIKVLNLVITGMSNAEVARELDIKVSTVKFHLSTIYIKLGVESRAQLLVKLLKNNRNSKHKDNLVVPIKAGDQ